MKLLPTCFFVIYFLAFSNLISEASSSSSTNNDAPLQGVITAKKTTRYTEQLVSNKEDEQGDKAIDGNVESLEWENHAIKSYQRQGGRGGRGAGGGGANFNNHHPMPRRNHAPSLAHSCVLIAFFAYLTFAFLLRL